MSDILSRFAEELIERYGFGWVFLLPGAVATVLGGFGLFTDRTVLVILGGAVFLLVIAFLLIGVSLRLRQARNRISGLEHSYATRERRIETIAERLIDDERDSLELNIWNDTFVFSQGGDLVLTRYVTIVSSGRSIVVFDASLWSESDPMTDKLRRRVTVDAKHVYEDGSIGARYDTTATWAGNRHRIHIHFDEPMPAHSERTLCITWRWPGYSRHLIKGETEDFYWRPKRVVRELRAQILFDKTCKFVRHCTISPIGPASLPTQSLEPDGSLRVTFAAVNPPHRQKIGFRIDAQPAISP